MNLMKSSLLLLLFGISIHSYSQSKNNFTVVKKIIVCPNDILEKVKKNPPGFYVDKEYFKNIKLGSQYSGILAIKSPETGKQSKAIPDLDIHMPVVFDNINLVESSLEKVEGLPPGATLTYDPAVDKPKDISCIEIKGEATSVGSWTPKFKLFTQAKILFTKLKVKSTWTGLTIKVK